MTAKHNPPIPLTNRLWQCRTKTRFQILRAVNQSGFVTAEVKNLTNGKVYQWSGNPKMPDSRTAIDRFLAAVVAARTAGCSPVVLTLVTRPDPKKAWEHFYWSFDGQGIESKKDPQKHGELEVTPIEALWAANGGD